MSYCEGVLEAVERRANGRPVARVGVRIGAVNRVVAGAFSQSFELAAVGSVAEGAVTEVVTVPVRGSCLACGAVFESVDLAPACVSCGALDVMTEGGDEVILEWIEYHPDDSGGECPADAAEHAAEVVPEHSHEHAQSTSGGGR
jgi:hydrogenase nickel incorporation protein HypA/HybF